MTKVINGEVYRLEAESQWYWIWVNDKRKIVEFKEK